MRYLLVALWASLCCWTNALAEARVVTLEARPGAPFVSYYQDRPGARANLLLLVGGAGGIGLKDGEPTSQNFLVRSRQAFAEGGFNLFLMGRPADRPDLDPAFRISADHLLDLRAAVDFLHRENGLPVWLVGTSRGTISATAAAIDQGPRIAGLVLTASVTHFSTPGAVPTQKLEAITVPTLVVHHQQDACRICRPHETGWIMDKLTAAPVKKLMLIGGGGEPRGDPCEALHWHGFIGVEDEVARRIDQWIVSPSP